MLLLLLLQSCATIALSLARQTILCKTQTKQHRLLGANHCRRRLPLQLLWLLLLLWWWWWCWCWLWRQLLLMRQSHVIV